MDDLTLVTRGLAVGIPISGKPTMPEWGISLAIQSWPINTAVSWLTVRGKEVGEARNQIVEEALKRRIRYLWFLDEDVAVPHFGISRLMFELRQRQMLDPLVKVVGGIYCTKSEPAQPIVFRGAGTGPFWEWTIGEVFPCDAIGGGCMLIDTEIFEHLERPWFKTVDEIHDDLMMFEPFEDSKGVDLRHTGNEDSYFCIKVRKAGFKMFAHGGVLCPHWDYKTGFAYVLPVNSYPVMSVDPGVLKAAEEKAAQCP